MEEYLCQDEKELEFCAQKLQQHGWLRWLVSLPDVIECNNKLSQCQDRLRVCQEQSRICKEALRRSDFQLSDCRAKIKSCTSELHYLQNEYESCRSVIVNIEEIATATPNSETTMWAKGGTAVGATVGAAAGTAVFPVVGTVVGVVTGAAVGYIRGRAVWILLARKERFVSSQLTRCTNKLKACERTLSKCQAMAEDVKNEIYELENLTHTFD